MCKQDRALNYLQRSIGRKITTNQPALFGQGMEPRGPAWSDSRYGRMTRQSKDSFISVTRSFVQKVIFFSENTERFKNSFQPSHNRAIFFFFCGQRATFRVGSCLISVDLQYTFLKHIYFLLVVYWLSDFIEMLTRLKLFLGRKVRESGSLYVHIYIFCVFLSKDFFLLTIQSNRNDF